MDVIGQYYAPGVKSRKERSKSKDSVDRFDHAAWDDYDVRTRRVKALEKRLFDLNMEREGEIATPVFKSKTPDIAAWIGQVATEQDLGDRSVKAVRAYSLQKKDE